MLAKAEGASLGVESHQCQLSFFNNDFLMLYVVILFLSSPKDVLIDF